MIKEGLILRVSDDDIETVIELLSGLEFTLILGLAVPEYVEIAAECVDLVDRVCREVRRSDMQRELQGHFAFTPVSQSGIMELSETKNM